MELEFEGKDCVRGDQSLALSCFLVIFRLILEIPICCFWLIELVLEDKDCGWVDKKVVFFSCF